ncbi:FISUMP domain-containing protein [Fibrobacter sp.]|uniref:FISUMP domain-containing protein n=1 Tax=Fibrobacter sp. TaxID=35828 RepID=UPI0038676E3E
MYVLCHKCHNMYDNALFDNCPNCGEKKENLNNEVKKMKCSSCNQELNFPEEVLKKFTSCPFCGAAIAQEKKIDKSLVPIEAELQKIVDDFGGLDVFSEENYSRLNKALMAMDENLAIDRDKLIVANVKKIPQKMYLTKSLPSNEQHDVAESCVENLSTIGLSKDVAKEIVMWLAHILGISIVIEEKKQNLKKFLSGEIVVNYKSIFGNEQTSFSYKSCVIGDKEWFAENLNINEGFYYNSLFYKTEYGPIGKDGVNEKFGRLYTWEEAKNNAPKGWRLPTKEDFDDLDHYIKAHNAESGTALKAASQWHGSADDGSDLFGFCAYPTARGSQNGESQAWFWTASPTGNQDYPHYCVSLSANTNSLESGSKATDNYCAAVRYVRDYDEKQWIDLKGNEINLYEWVDELGKMFRDDSIDEKSQKKVTFAAMVVKLLKEKLDLSEEFAQKMSLDIMKQLGFSED